MELTVKWILLNLLVLESFQIELLEGLDIPNVNLGSFRVINDNLKLEVYGIKQHIKDVLKADDKFIYSNSVQKSLNESKNAIITESCSKQILQVINDVRKGDMMALQCKIISKF